MYGKYCNGSSSFDLFFNLFELLIKFEVPHDFLIIEQKIFPKSTPVLHANRKNIIIPYTPKPKN